MNNEETLIIPEAIRATIEAVQGIAMTQNASPLRLDKIFPITAILKIQKKPGEKMPDNSIYLGYFEKQDWYVAAKDLSHPNETRRYMSPDEAVKYARKYYNAHEHDDWKLPPTQFILSEIYRNRDTGTFKGTFKDASHTDFPEWYWSSCEEKVNDTDGVWALNFSSHSHFQLRDKDSLAFVRYVRSVPRL